MFHSVIEFFKSPLCTFLVWGLVWLYQISEPIENSKKIIYGTLAVILVMLTCGLIQGVSYGFSFDSTTATKTTQGVHHEAAK